MKYFVLAIFSLVMAWLLPYHRSPWPTFGSEILTFIAASFLLLGFAKFKLNIPKPQLLLLPFLSIPLIQFIFGQNIYFSNALFSFAYILFFMLMVIAGYQLCLEQKKREQVFKITCLTFVSVGVISAIFAVLQWLDMHTFFSGIIYSFNGNRPYANLAQPNNLATLLILSLLSSIYLFEKKIISSFFLVPMSLITLFGVVLAQSRTSIIVCAFIVIYWLIKQVKKQNRFSHIHLALWVGLFILLSSNLASLDQWLFAVTDTQTAVQGSAIVAKGAGDIRLDMWQQMIAAILHQPWWGYGWNQTGLAQYYITDTFQVSLWYKSAHNMILDLLVWNGLILGGFILLYFTAWLLWLNKGVKDNISIIATLMVCAILIHGMLEFPLHYAYFLLPAGFLLGIIQAQYKNLPSVKMNGRVFAVIALITIVGALVTTRDYFLYKEQSVLASKTEALTVDQQHTMQKQIWLITQFKERVWWIGLDPKTEMTEQQLADLERMVANLASKYDLHKYAQVLAFNGKEQEAKHQLWILEILHKQHIEYDELLK
ncbi:PglL family O-oligosaccharyltransferase [Acinetobacter sp. DSM 11652]|uniref:PglL family O-oligosaccharyltransferase n=1 Tax=Acinetobacter sp. DSM 11652 TaxID=346222 RepID=UPI0008BB8EE2|nr:O-antigen ligase family protein [Acinetobacter sp. DSM 11652]SEL64825.1 O-antigen ligase [Acinetobacter sp. DSM 11652]